MSTVINPKRNANIDTGTGEQPPGGLVPVPTPDQPSPDTGTQNNTPPQLRPEDFAELVPYLLATSEHIQNIEPDTELERLRFIVKLRKFYMGNTIGRVSKWTNEWREPGPEARKKGKRLFSDPQLCYFVDSTLAQIVKSNPQVRVNARNPKRLDKKLAAEYATELWKDVERSKVKFAFRLREAKNYTLCGEAYRKTWFKKDVKGTEVRVPVHKEVQMRPSVAAWHCPLCNEGGALPPEMLAPSEMGMGVPDASGVQSMPCPKPECGFKRVEIIGAQGGRTVQAHVGYTEVPAGDVECEGPDPIEITVFSKAYGIEDTPYLTRDRLIMRGTLEDTFEGVEIPGSTKMPRNVQLQQELERTTAAERYGHTGTTAGDRATKVGGEQFELLHFREVWVDTALYPRYLFPKDTQMPNLKALVAGGRRLGDVFPNGIIPKGTRLKDVFPTGLYFCHVGNKILDIREENKADTWVHSCYYLGEGFHGIGLFALVTLQEQLDELRSLELNKLNYDSVTQTLVRKGAIEGSKLSNNPAAVVNVTNFPEEQPLSNVMMRVQPGREMTESVNMRRDIMNSAQNLVGNSSLMGGAPDVQGSPMRKALTTATGVAASQEQGNTRYGPPLGLRAEMISDQVVQALKLRQKNWPDEMYEHLDRQVGGDAGRWFREADIDRDFWVEIIPGTVLPLTEQQKREDLEAMKGYINPNDVAAIKQMQKQAGELFGHSSGFDINSYQQDQTEAQIRLDCVVRMAAALELDAKTEGVNVYDGMTGEPAPEMIGLILQKAAHQLKIVREMPEEEFPFVPVQPVLDRHDQYMEVYDNWLLSSEGRDSTLFQRTCIQGLILIHLEAQIKQKQGIEARVLETKLPQFFAQKLIASEGAKGEIAKQEMKVKGDLAKQALKGRQDLEVERERQAHEIAQGASDAATMPQNEGSGTQESVAVSQ